MTYRYSHHPRNRKSILIVCAYFIGIAAFKLVFNLADLWVAVAGFVAVPAIYDLARNAQSTLTLSQAQIDWTSGRQEADIVVSAIDYIRFDTRLDLSIKMSVILKTGRKIRVPVACTPPYGDITEALERNAIRHERHHFTLLN